MWRFEKVGDGRRGRVEGRTGLEASSSSPSSLHCHNITISYTAY